MTKWRLDQQEELIIPDEETGEEHHLWRGIIVSPTGGRKFFNAWMPMEGDRVEHLRKQLAMDGIELE